MPKAKQKRKHVTTMSAVEHNCVPRPGLKRDSGEWDEAVLKILRDKCGTTREKIEPYLRKDIDFNKTYGENTMKDIRLVCTLKDAYEILYEDTPPKKLAGWHCKQVKRHVLNYTQLRVLITEPEVILNDTWKRTPPHLKKKYPEGGIGIDSCLEEVCLSILMQRMTRSVIHADHLACYRRTKFPLTKSCAGGTTVDGRTS